ncbi:MAG: enoyl-CoA hydratase/isomerase family protein [Enterobacteriaceae bacterium]|jgi:enoyl-CoA hydratase|nr:enoyl-CoA hydratase/isomerase family protein [Enterobacteriaceae bacterium]
MSYIRYEQRETIGYLTIERMQALNSLNSEVIAEFTQQIDDIARSPIRCLVITGAGDKSFVAGADIAEMKDLNKEQAMIFSDQGNTLMSKIELLPFPVIAAVNGYAFGGGCELALCCDLRVASENAVFSLPETSLGIIPGYGGIQRLSRIIGLGRAKELVYTTRRLDAQEALRLGLLNAVYPSSELHEQVSKMATKIAANAPCAIRAAKHVFQESIGKTLAECLYLERDVFGSCFATQDQKMVMDSFVKKQKPQPFQGS